MGFIDSYKHLEKLCGEVLNDDRRVSAYIDEMLRTPSGSYYVRTWDEDLKNLKHYRWVRNKISHEPGYTEQNMCNPEDELWLDEFYSRIMNKTDPLSLYHQATRPRLATKTTFRPARLTLTYNYPSNYRKTARNSIDGAILTIIILLLLVVVGIVFLTEFISLQTFEGLIY